MFLYRNSHFLRVMWTEPTIGVQMFRWESKSLSYINCSVMESEPANCEQNQIVDSRCIHWPIGKPSHEEHGIQGGGGGGLLCRTEHPFLHSQEHHSVISTLFSLEAKSVCLILIAAYHIIRSSKGTLSYKISCHDSLMEVSLKSVITQRIFYNIQLTFTLADFY